jgi:hypothetical protein
MKGLTYFRNYFMQLHFFLVKSTVISSRPEVRSWRMHGKVQGMILILPACVEGCARKTLFQVPLMSDLGVVE